MELASSSPGKSPNSTPRALELSFCSFKIWDIFLSPLLRSCVLVGSRCCEKHGACQPGVRARGIGSSHICCEPHSLLSVWRHGRNRSLFQNLGCHFISLF